MRHQFIRKLKSEKGSSLAYVLIIGMVLLILVASLLAVANSDFTFTQESLESRQAYIDAKSVIEFGKIEINNREAILKEKNDDLNKLNQARAAMTGTDASTLAAISTNEREIKDKKDEINSYITEMKKSYYIGCSDKNNVSGTLYKIAYANATEENTAKENAEGILSVEAIGTEKTDYTFKIDTQNLSRKLDYKVDFGYEVKTTPATSNWNTLTYVPNAKPTNIFVDTWWRTNIYVNSTNNKTVTMESGLHRWNDINENHHDTLNIHSQGGVIINGDLTIGDDMTLNITCDNLWIEGDVVLGNNSTLTVTGNKNYDKKQMIVNGVIRTDGDDCSINISNLAYFESKGLAIDSSDLFKLESTNIVINGAISLTNLAGSNNDYLHNEITTQYFDCSGKTTISNSGIEQQPITFTPIDHKLVIRFAGGYDQQYSHVDINGADKVVFGKPFYLKSRDYRWYSWYDWYNSYYNHGVEHPCKFYWDHLYIEGNNIYLEGDSSNPIQMTWGAFIYDYNKNNNNTNVFIQSKINFLDNNAGNLGPGSYRGITHRWYNINQVWGRIVSADLAWTGEYSNSSGSTGAGEITNGAEIYY